MSPFSDLAHERFDELELGDVRQDATVPLVLVVDFEDHALEKLRMVNVTHATRGVGRDGEGGDCQGQSCL